MIDESEKVSRRRRYLWSMLTLCGVLGVGALVFASVPHTFTAGETLTAETLNGNFNTLDQRLTAVEALIPAGTIIAYGGPPSAGADGGVPVAPPGWLLCDGGDVSRTTYARLFGAIGVNFGIGDGINTFGIPDLRGRFQRGVDRGIGRDPEAASRTFDRPGGNSGDKVGSVQGDALKAHIHLLHAIGTLGAGPPFDTVLHGSGGIYQDNGMVQSTGGAETRPSNIALNYLIKL